jgi:hypothetical protein
LLLLSLPHASTTTETAMPEANLAIMFVAFLP